MRSDERARTLPEKIIYTYFRTHNYDKLFEELGDVAIFRFRTRCGLIYFPIKKK